MLANESLTKENQGWYSDTNSQDAEYKAESYLPFLGDWQLGLKYTKFWQNIEFLYFVPYTLQHSNKVVFL